MPTYNIYLAVKDVEDVGNPSFFRDGRTKQTASSSFEPFVVSFMQEDVYIGYTALALTLGLLVFS